MLAHPKPPFLCLYFATVELDIKHKLENFAEDCKLFKAGISSRKDSFAIKTVKWNAKNGGSATAFRCDVKSQSQLSIAPRRATLLILKGPVFVQCLHHTSQQFLA